MKKLNNAAIKKLLMKIEGQLNEYEGQEEFWTYKLSLVKNEIVCKIYDDEWVEYIIKIEKVEDTISILKGFINYVYENEINHRNAFIKGSDAFNRRKIKSLSNWNSKNNEMKCKDIQEELIARFNIARKVKNELNPFKRFVSDFYLSLNCLEKDWKSAEIHQAIYKKIREFNIEDVGITYVKDTIHIAIFDNEKEEIKDKFDIVVDSYSNTGVTVNNAINTIRKMVA